MVPVKDMEDHFREVEVGETYSIQVRFDDVIYNLWGMKGPNYVVRIMANSGHLLADEICKENVIIWKENGEYVVKKLKYKLPFYWHLSYRHVVYDHNRLSNSLPSTGDTWVIY